MLRRAQAWLARDVARSGNAVLPLGPAAPPFVVSKVDADSGSVTRAAC